MRRYIALLLVTMLAMSSIASASINCPCRRPGAAGVVTKFLARNGTTTNVTLYIDPESPSFGDLLTVVAGKAYNNGSIIIENLSVSLYVGSEKAGENWTDWTGETQFRILSAGRYVLKGGDYNRSFEIGGVEEIGPVDGTLEENGSGTAEENSSEAAVEDGSEAAEDKKKTLNVSLGGGPPLEKPSGPDSSYSLLPILAASAAAIAIIALVFKKRRPGK
jgi:hypothetical protein